MSMISLCSGWEYTPVWTEAFGQFQGPAQAVRLPHNGSDTTMHYAEPAQYERICGYRRKISLPDAQGKRVFLQFDGAAHIATVYVNGVEALTHRCGYTAFRVDLSAAAAAGDVFIAVKLDSTENGSVPPFGFVIDYLTYSGLYREVWLDIREESFLAEPILRTPRLDTLEVIAPVENAKAGQQLHLRVLDSEKRELGHITATAGIRKLSVTLPVVKAWSPEHPTLYTCQLQLTERDRVLDTLSLPFGFRTIAFHADGFYLNGEKVFLRGLNRHQCYPYLGYAASERLQREDARILRQELGCNAVRTSHYPQSHYFLDECDRQGLLVFTEIPGWQHIGDERWQDQAVENVREMVEQYRNHTSIVLWGVRINESQDNDALYQRTNSLAHDLDPTRPTSGVRYLEKSSLLEDVYAFNDFSHTGNNAGVKPKEQVTTHMDKALLITECNGHMFPTKPFDTWAHRQEHALRHARVQNDARADGQHAGCFGWCMFDYATHQDFGSGDRICYHGVLDSFRNPKLAAALYASQSDSSPVLEIGSNMDIGDYPAGNTGLIYLFTNGDEVKLYKNDDYVTTLRPLGWDGLEHGPILLDDTIGCLLETKEGFEPAKAELLKRCLQAAGRKGLTRMSPKDKLMLSYAMTRYHMRYEDALALYGRYVANWGGKATRWRFDAVKDGEVIASVTRCPSAKLHLELRVSSTELREAASWDAAAIRLRILDENGCIAPYAQYPVRFTVTGEAELVGPELVTAEGGMCGSYLRTAGRPGTATLTVEVPGVETRSIVFTVR